MRNFHLFKILEKSDLLHDFGDNNVVDVDKTEENKNILVGFV